MQLNIETDISGQEIIKNFEQDLLTGTGASSLTFEDIADESAWGAGERAFKVKVNRL